MTNSWSDLLMAAAQLCVGMAGPLICLYLFFRVIYG